MSSYSLLYLLFLTERFKDEGMGWHGRHVLNFLPFGPLEHRGRSDSQFSHLATLSSSSLLQAPHDHLGELLFCGCVLGLNLNHCFKGRIPGTDRWKPLKENPEAEESVAGILIVRIRENLDFGKFLIILLLPSMKPTHAFHSQHSSIKRFKSTFDYFACLLTSLFTERLRRLELYGMHKFHPSEEPRRQQASVLVFHLADVEECDASWVIIPEFLALSDSLFCCQCCSDLLWTSRRIQGEFSFIRHVTKLIDTMHVSFY